MSGKSDKSLYHNLISWLLNHKQVIFSFSPRSNSLFMTPFAYFALSLLLLAHFFMRDIISPLPLLALPLTVWHPRVQSISQVYVNYEHYPAVYNLIPSFKLQWKSSQFSSEDDHNNIGIIIIMTPDHLMINDLIKQQTSRTRLYTGVLLQPITDFVV